MGSSLSAIADDMDYYQDICTMLGINHRSDMYEHMSELEKAFGVKGKYDLIGIISKNQEQLKEKAFKEGFQAPDLKYLVKDNWVHFVSFRQGVFVYKLTSKNGKEPEHTFTVPLEDIGTATMLQEDKAITYMRWIRKAIEDKTLIQVKR